MSIITTKYHETLLRSFRGIALKNWFSSFFHFGQISKFKGGGTPWKKLNQKLWQAHLHSVSFITTVSRKSVERLQRSYADGLFLEVYLILAKFLLFKMNITPRENWIRIFCEYALPHIIIMSFITLKFHEILLLICFRGVELTKIDRTDGLTDGHFTLRNSLHGV